MQRHCQQELQTKLLLGPFSEGVESDTEEVGCGLPVELLLLAGAVEMDRPGDEFLARTRNCLNISLDA